MLHYKDLYVFEKSVPKHIENERDFILDKISKSGIKSLSEYEKEFIDSFKNDTYEEVYKKHKLIYSEENFKFELNNKEETYANYSLYHGILTINNNEIVGYYKVYDDGNIEPFFNDKDYELAIDTDDVENYSDFMYNIPIHI